MLRKLKTRQGFTLVEIMIVVAIIALLAAIAVPNLMRARHNANEGAALGTIRTVATAAESFRAVQTPRAWPADLAALAGIIITLINIIGGFLIGKLILEI